MSGTAGWMLHTLAGGGLLLLVAALAMARTRQPARRQRLGEWAVGAALLLAVLSLAPAWLVIPVAVPAPTGVASLLTDPAPDVRAESDPASADVWLLDGSARLAPPLGEPATPPVAVEVPPSSSVHWGRLVQRMAETLPILYLLGAAALLGHWLLGCFALAQILREATPAPLDVTRLCAEVGAHPLPRVLVSTRVAVPFSCGLLRPTIVLPARLVEDASPEALRWVLTHEWTHLERRDARAGWLFGLGRSLFFVLPWFWWMRHQVRLSQEYVADAAASAVGSPEDYAQFLLQWAGAPPAPAGAAGVIDRSSDLLRRITMLLQNETPVERHCPRRWSVLAACGLFAIGAVGGGIGLRAVAAPAVEKKEVKKDEAPAKKDAPKGEAKKDRPALPGFAMPNGALPPEFEEFFKDFPFDPANPDDMPRRMATLRERMQRAMERGGADRFTDVRPAQPRLGVKVEQPSAVLAEQLDLPRDQGLVCADVMPNSAAAKAGLKPNDILLEFAGKPVSRNAEEFLKVLAGCKPNTAIDVVVLRKGKKETVKGLLLPEMKESRVERPLLPRLNGLARKLPLEARAGAAGEKPAATTVVRNNDEFTAKHRDGACSIVVTGKMADGKANVTGIDITEAGEKHHWESLDKVPATHRAKVQQMIDLAQQGEAKE